MLQIIHSRVHGKLDEITYVHGKPDERVCMESQMNDASDTATNTPSHMPSVGAIEGLGEVTRSGKLAQKCLVFHCHYLRISKLNTV